jgi:MFS family permease
MTANLPFLLLAITLLWFPRQWLRLGSVFKRRRSVEASRKATEPWNNREPGDPRVNFGTEFSKFRNYLDLLRAAAGSLALSGGLGFAPSLGVADGAPRNLAYAVMAVHALILLVGLLVQTVRYEKRRFTFYPAIFFIAGLSVGLCDPRSAAFAFALIWSINAAFGNAQAFLTGYAVLIALFGHLFSRLGDLSVIYAAFLCFLPVLLSLLANRPLVIFSRKGTHAAK